jgi:hypothetical protein
MSNNYCGLYSKASVEWQKYFYDVHFGLNHCTIHCLVSELIPAGAIFLFNGHIIYYLVQTSHHFSQIIGHTHPKNEA